MTELFRRKQTLAGLGAVPTTRQVISGGGLTGGGDLSADRTLAVGAGTGITVNADDVALTIPVAVSSGGTGATTLTGLLQGNGTSAVTVITNSTTVGHCLRVTGSNTYAWGALDLADTDAVTGTLPVGNGGTGITSLGTGVATFLGTPSSANLLAAVTDETGTGALVFANTPTLVTPILGTPTSGTLTNCDIGTAWTSFTSNVTANTGSVTPNTVTVYVKTVGKTTRFFLQYVNSTTTGTGFLAFDSFPTSLRGFGGGGINNNTAVSINGLMGSASSTLVVRSATGAYPIAAGATITMNGIYEV